MATIIPDWAADIPDWVPSAVRIIALRMPVGPVLGETIRRRLLTDVRMEKKWRYLQRLKIKPAAFALDKLASWRLEEWEIPVEELSPQERAQGQGCAAFFASAVMEFSSQRAIGTRAQFQELAEPWRSAAELCRQTLCHEARVGRDAEFTKALRIVENYFEEQGQLQEPKDSPYIVERSSKERGDDEVRGRVRALALQTHALFGEFLVGTLALAATVAFQLKPALQERSVRNWCADLKDSGASA